MKKLLLTFVLLVGIAVGLFAQKLTYQAVVRDNNQQLVVNTAVKAFVTIEFSTGTPATYKDTVNGSTNIHGLLSFEFGGDALNGRDWTNATIAVKVVKANDESTVYVNDGARPVSAVPYALSVNGQSIQNYLTEHHYVDQTELDSRHYLTSDSAVITTMQGDIAALKNASMDCNDVKNCIKDTLSQYTPTTGLCDELNDCQFSGQTLAELLQGLTDQISDLQEQVDYLSSLPHGGGDTPTAFTCGSSKVKDVDNNKYPTVQIGNQCWMAQNLRTKIDGDGDKGYPTGASNDTVTYGRLYTWAAVTKGVSTNYPANPTDTLVHGICPAGWHVPSDAEWTVLTNYVEGKTEYVCGEDTNNIANALSSTTGWSSNTDSGCYAGNRGDKSNATGFAAVPAGGCFRGSFGDFSLNAYFWSATQAGDINAWYRSLGSNVSNVGMFNASKGVGFSVRCLRDAGVGGPAGGNEIAGTTPSAPGGDNACCSELGARLDSLEHVISSQDSTINALNEQVNPFTCGSSKVKDVDNNEYNTVAIGNQCWMAQNLRTKIGGDGDKGYPTGADNDTVTYGRLYTWAAVTKGASTNYPANPTDTLVHGICPDGWHVPSNAEWDTLTRYVFSIEDYKCGSSCVTWQAQSNVSCIANALSSSTGWRDPSECAAGYSSTTLNATGFSAVPAGYWFNYFDAFGSTANFWSATLLVGDFAWYRHLGGSESNVRSNYENKGYGFSVRCLRDAGIGGTPGDNETAGTTPSAPATMSCEDVMECMGDTLGKLNEKIEAQGQTITTQGHTIDSLAHIVDSLSNLTPGGGDTSTEVADGQPCPGAATVSDGTNTYNTVKIGNQCWMKENLRTTTKRNNAGNIYTENTQTGYNDETYGYYYDWAAVMQNEFGDKVRGICPEGWHVPSDAEWDTLTHYVFNSTSPDYKCGEDCGTWQAQSDVSCIAKALSQPTGWNSSTIEGCNAGNMGDKANATGFAAVPAGLCFRGNFSDFGSYAYFWSATQHDGGYAWCRLLSSYDSSVPSNYDGKDNGFSVRCLRDAGIGGTPGENETTGTTPSAPATMSCERVMECMGDTLGKLNTKIENLKNTVDSLAALIPGGDTVKFTCGTSKVKDFDNNEYNTVKIGNQCWMKENLKTTHYANGTGIGDEEMFNPGDNEAYVATYGKLYTWSAATRDSSATDPAYGQAKVQGICPAGWHVPSYVEWDTLTDYVKSKDEYQCDHNDENIAKALASKTGWNDSEESTCAVGNDQSSNNATGFNAVPAGDHGDYVIGSYAGFWLATKSVSSSAFYCGLLYSGSTVDRRNSHMGNGFSVRCLKD